MAKHFKNQLHEIKYTPLISAKGEDGNGSGSSGIRMRQTNASHTSPCGRERLRVISGAENIVRSIEALAHHATLNSKMPHIYIACDKHGLRAFDLIISAIRQEMTKSPNLGVSCITDITTDNLEEVRSLISSGINVRHIEGMKKKFVLTRTEYVVTFDNLESGKPLSEIIWTDGSEPLKRSFNALAALWEVSASGESRIKELIEKKDQGDTRIIRDATEIVNTVLKQIHDAQKQILILVASDRSHLFDEAVIQQLANRSNKPNEGRCEIRLLAPPSSLEGLSKLLPSIQSKKIERANFGIHLYDQNKLLIIEYATNNKTEAPVRSHATEKDQLKSAIFVSNRQMILGVASVFEALWSESELKEREENARRESQLLQDILTHDIRNYNQISRLSAELLQEELRDNAEVQSLTKTLVEAIDKSSSLLDRAKRLGMILSTDNLKLFPTDLVGSIERTISSVMAQFPDKNIVFRFEKPDLPSEGENLPADEIQGSLQEWPISQGKSKHLESSSPGGIQILADELLDDVFINVFSNSVKYTDGNEVLIEVSIKKVQAEDTTDRSSNARNFWNITIVDHGRGIPDEMKERLFARFLHGAKGSGLGMSIAFGLVVKRYGGKITVRDRLEHNHSGGTIIEILLPSMN